jgi:hypothetical protein
VTLDAVCGVDNLFNVIVRRWMLSYAQPRPVRNAAGLSVVVHALLIGLWVESTRPLATTPIESLTNRSYYLPPPDKAIVARGSHELVHYFTLAPDREPVLGRQRSTLQSRSAFPRPRRNQANALLIR